MNLTRKDLIAQTAEILSDAGARMSRADIEWVADELLTRITSAVRRGHTVRINGIGTIERVAIAPRMARNPRTGEAFQTRGGHRIRFRPSAKLKETL